MNTLNTVPLCNGVYFFFFNKQALGGGGGGSQLVHEKSFFEVCLQPQVLQNSKGSGYRYSMYSGTKGLKKALWGLCIHYVETCKLNRTLNHKPPKPQSPSTKIDLKH